MYQGWGEVGWGVSWGVSHRRVGWDGVGLGVSWRGFCHGGVGWGGVGHIQSNLVIEANHHYLHTPPP